VGAAEGPPVLFHPVADYAASAVSAARGQGLDRALEGVEGVRAILQQNLERLVVLIATDLTSAERH
jgi:hypothetical protein